MAVALRSDVTGTQTSNSTSWTMTYPGPSDIADGGANAIEAGDLIVINVARDGTTGTMSISGYTPLFQANAASASAGATLVKIASGSESGTFTFTPGASEQGVWRIAVLKGWWGTISGGVEAGGSATGTSTAPNPGSFSPSWGSAANWWRAVAAHDNGATTFTGFPSNFPDNQFGDESGGSGGAGLGGATLIATATSEDPNAFTLSASRAWRAWVVAVRPGATPTATSVARVSLASASTPATQTAHSIKARVRKTSGTGIVTFSAALYEGTNNRSGDLTTAALTTSLADYTLAIADGDAANITDYSNLEIRFWGNSSTGDTVSVELADIWLQAPAGTGGTTYTQTGTTVTGTKATGADVFEAAETAKALAGTKATGPDVFQATETGSGRTGTLAKGPDVLEATETGTLPTGTRASGADIFNPNETGSGLVGTKAIRPGRFRSGRDRHSNH